MTIASTLAAGHQSVRTFLQNLGNNLSSHRRRRLAAPMLCEALEPRTLLSAVSVNFTNLVSQTTTAPVTSLVTADLNEDGTLDIAALTSNGDLYVSLGTLANGQVSYSADKTTVYSLESDASGLIVGDFDNDSLLDLAYMSGRGPSDGGVVVLRGQVGAAVGTGSGAFDVAGGSKAITFADYASGMQITTANLNDDGVNDIVFAYKDGGNATHLVSVIGGVLEIPTVRSTALTGTVNCILVGNIDIDNDDDVVFVTGGGTINVAANDGTGLMTVTEISLDTTLNIKAIAFNDGGSDGLEDIFVLASDGKLYIAETNFLAPGTYTLPTDHQIGTFSADTTQLLYGRLDKDGYSDILGITSAGVIQVLLGQDDGAYVVSPSDAIFSTAGTTVGAVMLADFNNDNNLDLVSGLNIGDATGLFGISLNSTYLTSTHTLNATARRFTYVDDNGDTVVVTLSGPGSATIGFNDAAKQIAGIVLTGTTVRSSLAFTITNKANKLSPKTTTIGMIRFADGSLGTLSAAGVDFDSSLLSGDFGGIRGADDTNEDEKVNNATSINTIKIRDLGQDCRIDLRGEVTRGKTSLTARVIGDDTVIRITQAMSYATFVDFGACEFRCTTLGTFTIKGDKKLNIAGDFKGTLGVDGIDGSKANALNLVRVAGALIGNGGGKDSHPDTLKALGDVFGKDNGGFSVGGHVGTVIAGSIAPDFGFTARGRVTRIASLGAINGDFDFYSAGAISARGGSSELRIQFDSEAIIVGPVLKSLAITGAAQDLTVIANGSVGAISVGSMNAGDISVDGKLTAFRARGNMNGNLAALSYGTITVDGNSNGAELLIGSAGVGGGLGATVQPKLASSIYFRGDVVGLTLTSKGNMGAFRAKSLDATSVFKAEGTVDSIRTDRDCGGTYTIEHVKTWLVYGSMNSVTATLGVDGMDAGAKMLDTLTVVGAMSGSTIQGYGDIGTISAKTLLNSNIYAGYIAAETPLDSLDDFNSVRSIGSVTVTGDFKSAGASTTGAKIYANLIKKVSLASPDADTKPVLLAHTVDSLTVKTLSGKRIVSDVSPSITGPTADPKPADNVTVRLL